MTELSDSLWVSYDESMPLPRGTRVRFTFPGSGSRYGPREGIVIFTLGLDSQRNIWVMSDAPHAPHTSYNLPNSCLTYVFKGRVEQGTIKDQSIGPEAHGAASRRSRQRLAPTRRRPLSPRRPRPTTPTN